MLKDRNERLDFLLVLPWFNNWIGEDPIRILPTIGAEFPFSIAVLMAYIGRCGFTVKLLDLNVESRPLDVLGTVLKTHRPRIIGISSYSDNILNAEAVAIAAKQFDPDVNTVLGGFHATALPQESLKQYSSLDYVMFGECEKSLPIFIERILNHGSLDNTPNLALRHGETIVINPSGPIIENLDDQPFPILHKLDIKRYTPLPTNFYRLPSLGIMSSRGCPFKCTFCATHFHQNKHIRRMSRGLLVDWIEKIITDFGVRDFRFYDDIFTIPRSSVIEFCEEVLKRTLKISWNCYSRVDTLDKSTAKLMKRAGCYHIKFGIEAGTEKSLKRINKHIHLKQAIETVRVVKQLGIETKASFIIGIHEETLEDSKKTVNFALSLALHFVTFLIMRIYPGSEDYNLWEKQGKIPNNFNWGRPLYTSDINIEDLTRLLKIGYRKFYWRPKFFIDQFRYFVHNPLSAISRLAVAIRYFILKIVAS